MPGPWSGSLGWRRPRWPVDQRSQEEVEETEEVLVRRPSTRSPATVWDNGTWRLEERCETGERC